MTSHVSVFGSLVRQWIHIYVSLQRPGSADIFSRCVAVTDQKDYCTFYWQWHVQGLVCWPFHPLRVWQAQMLGILAGMNQKDRFAFYTVVHTPVVCNDMALVTGCRKLKLVRSCSPFSWSSTSLSYRRGSFPAVHTVVHVPVYRSCRFPLWRRGMFPWSRLLVGP